MNRRAIRTNLNYAVFLTALFALLAIPAFGISLEDHKARTEVALDLAFRLEDTFRDGVTDNQLLLKFLMHVREKFPVTEKIEWQGGTVESSNEWLRRQVDELAQLEEPTARSQKMLEIRQYLSTIVFKLRELDQPATDSRTKDEDKQKLAEILRREEYQKPKVAEESAISRWLREFWDWLEKQVPRPNLPSSSGSGMEALAFFLQVVFYIGLFVLLALIIVKVAPLLFPKLKRKPKPKKKSRVILGEHIDDDETAHDLFNDAERLARQGDLRGAIRKGYIALLCDLADRKVIGLALNKTNRDYVRDVRSRAALHPRMKSVTDTFERHWYGSRESEEQDWTQFRDEYKEAIRSV